MFLKKIEMQGFKSFADRITINFDDPVTGIVGPNGCGKSNISDAIRWVLGEQSVKSMRGSSMTDVIFNGSENRKKVNLAEVTLVFDNQAKVLNSDYEEVEITRRLYRDTRESEYLINKVNCRLRDVQDLVMDTGLGRDSLSIISQGTISFFAEAKPQERRIIFEEAAGVSKYKKRKLESINKLERTKENIDRMQDVVDEISRQMNGLKRAAQKATIYQEKKARLESVEVSFLCRDIEALQVSLKELQAGYQKTEGEIAHLETNTGVYEHDLESKRQEMFELDQAIQKAQEQMMRLVSEIGQLETRKAEVEERRKYTLEVGDTQAKIAETAKMLQEAEVEYLERKERHAELKAEVEMLSAETSESSRKLSDKREAVMNDQARLQQTLNQLELIKHRLERPYEHQAGVKSILENKTSIYGIHDVVEKLLIPHEDYEVAISTALAAASTHIVTEDDKAAVQAINFLKKNMSGRATFVPLSVSKPRSVNHDALTVAEHMEGFLGVASAFVDSDAVYADLRDSLLGNVLLVTKIDDANQLARHLNYNYKIVTLDGDVIHRGGIMSGGKAKQANQSISTMNRDKAQLEMALAQQKDALGLEENTLHTLEVKIRDHNDALMERRIALAQIEPLLDVKRAKYERLKQEYEDLDPEGRNQKQEHSEDDVVIQLNQILMQKDELSSNLSLMRERRHNLGQEFNRKEGQLREFRKELNELTKTSHEQALETTKQSTRLENSLERLSSEYQMTYEYAFENVYDANLQFEREEILKLRTELTALGNVNLEAPAEYEETKERFEFLDKQLKDLVASRDKLLAVIEEMDDIMIEQFQEMFVRINEELKTTFTALFGGGRARLVLEDEQDLLNTGVDIDVQPPGKSVQNIRLFSGGEKSLIAIAVLFAILKARHVPLCIFDEVEAALDQANVERLAHTIRDYSETSQFIVITHRPGTMAQADILYGVTMPTQGVSSILHVRLEEAVELKEMQA